MDVLNIQGIQRSLERLADLLSKVQKALGEYLERERASFPRFYFVGDEDLLEIIGNSKNLPRLQKHFKKMFAGMCGFRLRRPRSYRVPGMGKVLKLLPVPQSTGPYTLRNGRSSTAPKFGTQKVPGTGPRYSSSTKNEVHFVPIFLC